MKIAIVKSSFNSEINDGLLAGAREYLNEQGHSISDSDIYPAPGAFEMPLIARQLVKRAGYDGIICLACVIKGETAHFEYISLAATMGILQTGLDAEKPVSFGVLTTYNRSDAVKRAAPGPENKGREAAAACWETLQTLQKIRG